MGEVRDLEIKEMVLEEKYDKLYDSYILTYVIAMAFIMENGLTEEYLNYTMKVYKKMMPSSWVMPSSSLKRYHQVEPSKCLSRAS